MIKLTYEWRELSEDGSLKIPKPTRLRYDDEFSINLGYESRIEALAALKIYIQHTAYKDFVLVEVYSKEFTYND